MSLKKPEKPYLLTSESPPALLEITGTPAAIASRAARPKLSDSEGRINKSAVQSISLISKQLPKKRAFSKIPSSWHKR